MRSYSMRLFGSDIPENKRVIISLTYIFGIGPYRASVICNELHIPLSMRVQDLSDDKKEEISNYIEKNFGSLVGEELKKRLLTTLKNYVSIKSRRGIRGVLKGLPVNGQRTHSNGKTSKKLRRRT